MATSNMTAISSASGMLQYCIDKKGASEDRVKSIYSTLLSSEKDIEGMTKELLQSAGRKYEAIHFRVSFDPKDRKLTDREMDNFINDLCAEYLGSRNYVAIRHGDTDVDHIHIVASFLDAKGRCLSFADRAKHGEAIRQIESVAKICTKYGLSSLAHEPGRYRTSRDGVTLTEKKMREKHLYIWKDDLKGRLDQIRAQSTDLKTYIDRCKTAGIEVRQRGQTLSYKFVDKDNKQRICRGHKIGQAYTLSGVQQSIVVNSPAEGRTFDSSVQATPKAALPLASPKALTPDLTKMVSALSKLGGSSSSHSSGNAGSSGSPDGMETAEQQKSRHAREYNAVIKRIEENNAPKTK